MKTASASLALGFGDIDAAMLAEVGGKAANLGELTRAGLPVPPGCCLTTRAYHRVAEGGRPQGGHRRAGGHGGGGHPRAGRTGGQGESAAAAGPRSPRRCAPPSPSATRGSARGAAVAVRSSATAEDLPYASFAGQQDTYLNVVGAEAVQDAVRRCWASLWTDRAVAYRASNGIDHAAVRLAVVLQRMVEAEVAGVMFTANPVTGRRREAVIDAAPGLGEAVVSGAVNPDRFVVDLASTRIVERRIGDKRVAIRSLPGGGTERIETPSDEPCLTDERVRALAALGARVEDHYGSPQDTEWAIDADGTLWLTQARPITTLYPVPETNKDGLRVYFSVNVAQGRHAPVHPDGDGGLRTGERGRGGPVRLPTRRPAGRSAHHGRGGAAAVPRHHARRPEQGGPDDPAADARRRRGPRGGDLPAGRAGPQALGHQHLDAPPHPYGDAGGRPRRRARARGPRAGQGRGRRSPSPGVLERSWRPGWRSVRTPPPSSGSTTPSGCCAARSRRSCRSCRSPSPATRAWALRGSCRARRASSCRPSCAACRTTPPPRWTWSCGTWPGTSPPTPRRPASSGPRG
ncbi:PEP/pyruvate-binding domain-containing protein [Nonomuraea dietziae]|uniref:PEP/pyruvate-binding domain-containing protein n=1 Tax=Nonomuraea dietziae TaxID=65515 RepID=UPI0031D2E93D